MCRNNSNSINNSAQFIEYSEYDSFGNLTTKTITLAGGATSNSELTYSAIAYNSNNKPVSITNHNGTTTTFAYGSDGLLYKQATDEATTHYVAGGSYEVEIKTSETKTRAYIGDYAVMNRSSNGTVGLKYLVMVHFLPCIQVLPQTTHIKERLVYL